jgi:hypothetical protein
MSKLLPCRKRTVAPKEKKEKSNAERDLFHLPRNRGA